MIVPTLRVGMPHWTLRVRSWDAERPWLHSHAERGNDRQSRRTCSVIHNLNSRQTPIPSYYCAQLPYL
ncbi:hypothetical protein EYC95_14740 [Pseudomonas sp. BGI-2]|nr:hypothetical protein EYC95_14740 [Pseudomonas sp. BGI-2]